MTPLRPHREHLRPVEPFGHRGRRLLRREALAAAEPVVELGVGTGRIAIPTRRGVHVIGVDSSPGMLAVARGRGGDAGVADLVDLRLGDLREPPVPERVDLVTLPLPLAAAHADEAESCGAPRRPRPARRRAVASSSTSSRQPRRHRGDARALDRTRARDLRAGGLGRGLAHAVALRALRRRPRRRGLALALGPRVAAASRRGRPRGRGLHGWFDGRPYEGDEDMVFVTRASASIEVS